MVSGRWSVPLGACAWMRGGAVATHLPAELAHDCRILAQVTLTCQTTAGAGTDERLGPGQLSDWGRDS